MIKGYILKKKLMQKLAVGIVVALFILTIFLPVEGVGNSPEKILPNDTILEVKIIDEPYAVIRNIGNADAINVRWEMWLECPILFISPGKQSGNIDRIKVGNEEIISYDMNNLFIFGFGLLELKAIAMADNAEPAGDARPIGLLIGSYILVLP